MGEKEDFSEKLEKFRKDIDNIDDKIAELLNKRGEIVLEIGKIKKEHNLDIKQPNREIELIKRVEVKSRIYKKKRIQAIWKEILNASRELQDSITKSNTGPFSDFKKMKSPKN